MHIVNKMTDPTVGRSVHKFYDKYPKHCKEFVNYTKYFYNNTSVP